MPPRRPPPRSPPPSPAAQPAWPRAHPSRARPPCQLAHGTPRTCATCSPCHPPLGGAAARAQSTCRHTSPGWRAPGKRRRPSRTPTAGCLQMRRARGRQCRGRANGERCLRLGPCCATPAPIHPSPHRPPSHRCGVPTGSASASRTRSGRCALRVGSRPPSARLAAACIEHHSCTPPRQATRTAQDQREDQGRPLGLYSRRAARACTGTAGERRCRCARPRDCRNSPTSRAPAGRGIHTRV